MNKITTILISLFILLGCGTGKNINQTPELSLDKRELKVSLYPYIPNAESFYCRIEKLYEEKFPEIDLKVELNSLNYYDHEGKGIIESEADVYEIDAILLLDFIKRGKLQKLPAELIPNEQSLLSVSSIAKLNNDDWFGYPHWACGNFLYLKNNDSEAIKTSNLSDIERILSKNDDIQNSIFIDLKGTSTIGEHYFDALMDELGDYNQARKYVSVDNINKSVLNNLNRVIDVSYKDFGRNDNYHDNTGFYGRQFARNKGRIMVGYSELLYYLIDENIKSCSKEDSCINQGNLTIKEWYFSDKGSNPISWVDVLSIDSKLTGQKLKDASDFIHFMISDEIYKEALIPKWGEAPRYLLPTKKSLFKNEDILKEAPLYPNFYKIIQKAVSTTDDQLSPKLREIGRKLDKELLIENKR
ncbi:hypothetical protein [Persicobacter diffluens]|uniref:Thiaminase-1 insert domain-containing protein n=1 Tax=Persicobacter diffluens TaxID=981 RepID=A0AAN4W4Z8_9BACT|nr:hypothetical protein PEDI_53230 [Persicobacter diffluens]